MESEDYEDDNVLYVEHIDTHPLSYPLPTRCRVTTEHGYATQPWTVDDVRLAKLGGGWFDGQVPYQFADAAARRAAFNITEGD